MTNLSCSVHTCAHNSHELCALNSINVEGHKAHRDDETLCGSFAQRSGNMQNAASHGDASPSTSVSCEATDCIYNMSQLCSASSIQVDGHSASTSSQTQCSTFKKSR